MGVLEGGMEGLEESMEGLEGSMGVFGKVWERFGGMGVLEGGGYGIHSKQN